MSIVATALLLTLGQSPADDTIASARPAEECPTLFGTAARRDANAAWRGRVFHGVRRGERTLDVFHSMASWRAPVRMRLPGVEVVAIERDESGEALAFVHVDEQVGACEGDYALDVDDSIGADANVLAVLEEGVLVMHDGDLVLLGALGAAPPDFRMIWQSGFVVDVAASAKGKASGAKTNAARARSSKAKSRAKRTPRRTTTAKKPKG